MLPYCYIRIRPVFTIGIGHCNPLSAVCRIVGSAGFDLGYFSSASLRNDSQANLVLTYIYKQTVNGASCPHVTTDIQFVCNHSAPIDVSGCLSYYV